ncbi:PTS fructose transporter IIABC [Streptococcus agalactiae LMG 14747]|uniref:PTS fructose transporter IIABC n=1 Tax=Streptococcus agalactiae LMG 14747 TaxID=1154860 RepID=V6YYZ8_STRAG|nr:PTS fructose transporter IIABC [Streptococcus agalactiae LMG 14747]
MNIVGIAACTAGIAHTYIAKEKLVQAGQSRGHTIHIETQGLAGRQDALTTEEIAKADIVIIAADIKINGRDRFENKKVVEVPTTLVVKSPNKLIEKLEELQKGG